MFGAGCHYRHGAPLGLNPSFGVEGQREEVGDMADEMDFEFLADFDGDFGPVRFVLVGQNDLFYSEASGGEDFFFNTANAHDASAKADFASHGDIGADAPMGEERSQGGNQGYASAWAVFRGSAGGDVD